MQSPKQTSTPGLADDSHRPVRGANLAAQPVRVFVGIKVAPEIAQELADLVKPFECLPVRLVPPADIHLTLVPPWNETNMPGVIEKLHKAARGLQAVTLTFAEVAYGPSRRRPRLLWAECVPTQEIAEMHASLFAALGQMQERPFRPHVTLARLQRNGRAVAGEHPFNRTLSLTQSVDAIQLFKSPGRGKKGYEALVSVPLGRVTAKQQDAFGE